MEIPGEAAGINSEVCQQFRLLRNFRFFFSFKIFGKMEIPGIIPLSILLL